MGLPPVPGAVQLTFADPLPAVADTPVGAPGAVGCEPAADFSTTVSMSQIVLAPVPAEAFGVALAATGWSSTSSSASALCETFTRLVNPAPAVSASPNPESA